MSRFEAPTLFHPQIVISVIKVVSASSTAVFSHHVSLLVSLSERAVLFPDGADLSVVASSKLPAATHWHVPCCAELLAKNLAPLRLRACNGAESFCRRSCVRVALAAD